MERFVVSARKYRPQDFSSVVGQSHITTTLINAIKNQQLAHAFLFCGPRGVGKTTCARILAKTINCENRSPDGEACNHCASCRSFNEGSSLNIHELDAASNNSVDDIRTLVEQVRFAPQAGQYKVYIIDEVHMLSSSAFNAFLKTLEEPPPYAIFILATTEKYKILPTILSRCQIFDFKRITLQDTVHHLQEICRKEQVHTDKAALQVIAQKSEGCMRDALSILDKIASFTNGQLTYEGVLEHLNILDEDYYFRLMEAMRQQQLAEALMLLDDINQKGFDLELFLNGITEFFRNLLVCKDPLSAPLLDVVENFRDKYVELAARMPVAYLLSGLNLLAEAELQYKGARNKRLHVELALIKLSYLGQALSLAAEAGQLKVTAKVTERAKPVAFRSLAPQPLRTISLDNSRPATQPPPSLSQEGARLLIQEMPVEKNLDEALPVVAAGVEERQPAVPVSEGPTLGTLSRIRQQFALRQQGEIEQSLPLDPQKLQEAWLEYTRRLREAKHTATQSFQRAQCRILSPDSFEVVTPNNLEQKFIEQEKRGLTDWLQTFFRNKSLSFSVVIDPLSQSEVPGEKTLTRREQYQQLAEQYPFVKTLKERLRLDLDY